MALKKKKIAKKKIVKRTAPNRKPVKKLKPKSKVKSRVKTRAKTAKTKKTNLRSKAKPSIKNDNVIGKIIHYFPHVKAAVIKLSAPLSVGEKIKIKGHTTDFTQVITSMQMDRVDITSAKPKEEIGLLVNSRVRQHDTVYKI
jgi:putative protease